MSIQAAPGWHHCCLAHTGVVLSCLALLSAQLLLWQDLFVLVPVFQKHGRLLVLIARSHLLLLMGRLCASAVVRKRSVQCLLCAAGNALRCQWWKAIKEGWSWRQHQEPLLKNLFFCSSSQSVEVNALDLKGRQNSQKMLVSGLGIDTSPNDWVVENSWTFWGPCRPGFFSKNY